MTQVIGLLLCIAGGYAVGRSLGSETKDLVIGVLGLLAAMIGQTMWLP